jgi:hypothetical protein
LTTLALALLAGNALAENALVPHTAVYKVKISIAGGRLDTKLEETEAGYVATHIVKPKGLAKVFAGGQIREVAEFASTDDGVIPLSYRSKDSLSRDKEQVDIQFDWNAGEARGTVNNAFVVSAIDGLAHDRVSIQYELMHDLLNGGPDAQYFMYDVDKMRTIDVRNVGKKIVNVPAGRFEAVGIEHQAVGSKRITTLWCVEELGYLPVIIEQRRLGKLKARSVLAKYLPLEVRSGQ